MVLSKVLQFCERHRDWLVDTTTALAELESPTSDKGAVDRCGHALVARLRDLGGSVETIPQTEAGDHIRATFGDGSGQLLMLGHFDTVWPVGQLQRMPLRHDGGRLHGPGVYDMKAGIAMGMLAVRALTATGTLPRGRIVMLLTSDEERGSVSSRALVEAEARRSEAVLVLEPALAGGAVKTARKGAGEFRLEVRGVAAHAGIEPEKGASAIEEIVRQALYVTRLRDPQRGISINIGTIEGGTRPNVVAEQATAAVDVRVSTMADAAAVERALRALTPHDERTTVAVTGSFSRPPLERNDGVARLYLIAKAVAADLGQTLSEGSTGGGSDGNLTAALGVPTLDGLGAVGDGAHALHEHVVVGELPGRVALLAGLVKRLLDHP